MSSVPRIRAWRFSSARPGCRPGERLGQQVEEGRVGLLDGDRQRADPEVGGQRLGVGDAVVAGVAGRHEDAGHVLGPEGVDGHGRHHRRVDPARQADDHVGEAGSCGRSRRCRGTRAAHTSASGVERRLDAGRLTARSAGGAASEMCDLGQRRAAGPAPGVEEPLAERRAGRRGRRRAGPPRTAGPGPGARPDSSKTADPPSKTSSSCPPTRLT